MKIWFVNQYAYTPNQAASTRHFAYARELIRRGHEVCIISSSFYHKHRRQDHYDVKNAAVRAEVETVPFVWLRTPSYRGNLMRGINMVVFAVRLIMGQGLKDLPLPDILYCTSPSPLAALAGGIVARRFQATWVVEIVDLWPDTLIEVGGMKPWHPFVIMLRLIEKHLYLRADAIVTHLCEAPRHFQRLGASPKRTHFLPSVSPFDPIPAAPPAPSNEGTVFAYVGAMGKANALSCLLDAWDLVHRQAPDLHSQMKLILLGDGNDRPTLERRAAAAPWADTVIFKDPIPKFAVLDFLATIDVGVAVSQDHQIYKFGISFNKIFDYLAAAKPVVLATSAPGTPIEICGAGRIVPPARPDALAAALIELTEMPHQKRHELGLRGYDHIAQHHLVRHWVDRAERLFSTLLLSGTTSDAKISADPGI